MTVPKPRVLCTEDDRDTRDMISIILRGEGFEVICAGSPSEAIELVKTQTIDLVLVDNWMPGLSGTQLTERIREFDVKTPILFYSGAAYDKDKEAARLAGAQGYLVKPVAVDELIAEVSRLIAESKSTHSVPVTKPLASMCRSAG